MTSESHVHVIDDDADMRGALGSLLRSAGMNVALYDAPEAFLMAERPDTAGCLILDIRLQGESGLDFQERLLAQGIDIPVILITGHGDIPMTVRGMRAGAVDFLPKPFTLKQLASKVKEVLDQKAVA